MKDQLSSYKNKSLCAIVWFLSSKWMFGLVLFAFLAQALWVALFFNFPLVFDENFHYHAIKAFAHYDTPVIIDQSEEFDHLGSLTFGSASIFHYFMSLAYQFIGFFTTNEYIQIVSLRVLNIILAASTFFILRKLFMELGVKKHLIHVALFIFANIPMLGNVSATINYDNLLLPLTALFFLYGSRLLYAKNYTVMNIFGYLCVGIFAALTKFTFTPLFVIATIYIAWYVIKHQGIKGVLKKMRASFRKTARWKLVALSIIIFFLFMLGGFRYGVSMALYGTPIPDCKIVLAEDRCDKNPVNRIFKNLVDTRESRPVMESSYYVRSWLVSMTSSYTNTGNNTPKGTTGSSSPPIYHNLVLAGTLMGIMVSIYMWRSMNFDRRWHFIVFSSLGLLTVLMLFNMSTYYQYHSDINLQPRYALSVLPLLLMVAILSLDRMLKNAKILKLLFLIVLFLGSTQGAGVITQVLASKEDWYWQKPRILEMQEDVRGGVDPLVKSR